MKAAIVLPLYNHASRVTAVIEAARSLELPIIVVNDGSTDDAAAVLAALSGVTLIHHASNLGKGAALISGFQAAMSQGCDWALSIDADGQHAPEDGRRLLARAAQEQGARPIVVGRRSGMEGEHVPWSSRVGRGVSNFWIWACGGPRLSDSQSGFRLYPLPECLELGARSRRYQFEVEILVLAALKGMPVVETPIQVFYQPKGERISHFRPALDFFRNASVFRRLFIRRLLSWVGWTKER